MCALALALGKGEVVSSILTGSTRKAPCHAGVSLLAFSVIAQLDTKRRTNAGKIWGLCSAGVLGRTHAPQRAGGAALLRGNAPRMSNGRVVARQFGRRAPGSRLFQRKAPAFQAVGA